MGALTMLWGGQGHMEHATSHCRQRRQLFKMTFIYLFKCKCSAGTFFRLFASAVKIRGRKHQGHGGETGRLRVTPPWAPARHTNVKGYIVSTLWFIAAGVFSLQGQILFLFQVEHFSKQEHLRVHQCILCVQGECWHPWVITDSETSCQEMNLFLKMWDIFA